MRYRSVLVLVALVVAVVSSACSPGCEPAGRYPSDPPPQGTRLTTCPIPPIEVRS